MLNPVSVSPPAVATVDTLGYLVNDEAEDAEEAEENDSE